MTKTNTLVLAFPKGLRQLVRDLLPPLLTRLIDRFLHRDSPLAQRLPAPCEWQLLEAKLWGGFSHRALLDLESLKGNPATPAEDVSGAARVLCGWYASTNDAVRAHENALLARIAEPRFAKNELLILIETDALLALGHVTLARKILTKALRRHPSGVLALAMANTYATPKASRPTDDEARLRWMNDPLLAAGLAPLTKIDDSEALSIENLTAKVDASSARPHAEQAKISVIIPAYRAEKTLPLAVKGLLAQTWTNLEIIVVDDLSSDRTFEVARSFAEKDPRVVAIQQEANLGAYAARNVGLRHATGDFVTVHDADDWSHPQKLAVQAEHLLANPEVLANLTDWVRCLPHLYFRGRARAVLSWIHFNHSSLLLRRERLLAMGGWDDVRIASDSELIRRLEHLSGGKRTPRVHQGIPLSFALVAETSLTQQGLTHARTLRHGVRRTYFEASKHWLDHQSDANATVHAASGRPFPVPPFILPVRGATRELDLLFLQDFTQRGDPFKQTLRAIDAALQGGKRVGLFHWPHYESDVSEPLPGEVWSRAESRGLAIVTPGETLDATTVVCRTPSALLERLDLVPQVRCQRFVCSNGSASDEAATARLAAAIRQHFGVDPSWEETPSSPSATSFATPKQA